MLYSNHHYRYIIPNKLLHNLYLLYRLENVNETKKSMSKVNEFLFLIKKKKYCLQDIRIQI